MFTRSYLLNLKLKALKRKIWFKVSLEERAIIDLTCRVVEKVKSKILKIIIIRIVRKIKNLIKNKLVETIYEVGSKLATKYAFYAVKWGNIEAAKWIKDEAYVFYLGLSWMNTSSIYKMKTL